MGAPLHGCTNIFGDLKRRDGRYSTLPGLRGARRARFSGVPPSEGQPSLRREIELCFHRRGKITELNNSVIFPVLCRSNSRSNRNARTRARTRSPFSDESAGLGVTPAEANVGCCRRRASYWIIGHCSLDILRSVSPRRRVAASHRFQPSKEVPCRIAPNMFAHPLTLLACKSPHSLLSFPGVLGGSGYQVCLGRQGR